MAGDWLVKLISYKLKAAENQRLEEGGGEGDFSRTPG